MLAESRAYISHLATCMNQINPEKLLHSKWTAVTPVDRQRHFIVTRLVRDEHERVTHVDIEAVLTRRVTKLPWQQLKQAESWLHGWQ